MLLHLNSTDLHPITIACIFKTVPNNIIIAQMRAKTKSSFAIILAENTNSTHLPRRTHVPAHVLLECDGFVAQLTHDGGVAFNDVVLLGNVLLQVI